MMSGHYRDPNDPLPPRSSAYYGNYHTHASPSLSHGAQSGSSYQSPGVIGPRDYQVQPGQGSSGRYGQIQLRPHSAYLPPQPYIPPPHWAPEPSRPYGSGPSGLISDDRVWHRGASTSPGVGSSSGRDRVIQNRSPSTRSSSHDHNPTPSRHAPGARRVVSPMSLSQHNDVQQDSRDTLAPSPHPGLQIERSWTLDSPARSSLDLLGPSHASRPLTRSPFLGHVSPDSDGSGYWDGGRSAKRDRVGPPPKAKLGGPGGKTYEEMRAGDSRIVSAPARTPPARSERQPEVDRRDKEQGRKEEDKGPPQWDGKTVAVRLPPSALSVPPTQPPTQTPIQPQSRVEVAEDKMEVPYPPGHTVTVMPQQNQAPPAAQRESTPDRKTLTEEEKVAEALSLIPGSDFYTPQEMQRARDEIRRRITIAEATPVLPGTHRALTLDERLETTLRTGHKRGSSSTSSKGSRFAIPPGSLGPRFTLPSPTAFMSVHHRDFGIKAPTPPPVQQLRPFAPSFNPSTDTRRVFTEPRPTAHAVIGQQAQLVTRRSVSDIGGEGRAKRLRGNAQPFRPRGNVGGHTSQVSGTSVTNPYSSLWLPANTAVDISLYAAGDNAAGLAVADQVLASSLDFGHTSAGRFRQSSPSTAFQVGQFSPSHPQTSMKRSVSGRLRSVAPSFVPTGDFTFRPTNAPAYPSAIRHATASSFGPSSWQDVGNDEGQSVFPAPMTLGLGQSPASRLHDLPDSDVDHEIGAESTEQEISALDQAEEEGIEILSQARSHGGRSGAPSPPSGIASRASNAQLYRPIEQSAQRLGTAHLPTESFGLPSPELPADTDVENHPERSPSTETTMEGDLVQPSDIFTPLIDAFPPPPTSMPNPVENPPFTPIDSVNQPLLSSAEPYETVDGSPLIPRRYLETPATPHKTNEVESQIPTLLSPTPARLRSRSILLDQISTLSGTTSVAYDSPPPLVPTFARSETQGDTASNDKRFRNWMFPNSPTLAVARPPVVRRYTFPVPSQAHASLAGIASTALACNPIPAPSGLNGMELGIARSSSARTTGSVEFPLRPAKRTLAVVNDVLDDMTRGENAVRPTASSEISLNGGGANMKGYLERIEAMVLDIEAQSISFPMGDLGRGDTGLTLGEQLAGIIAEMRISFEDRLKLPTLQQSGAPNLEAEFLAQRELLIELFDRVKPTLSVDYPLVDAKQLNLALTTLLKGQASLLDQSAASSESQAKYGRDAQAAVEAVRSMKEDLELRKAGEEKKDEVIDALRKQAEDVKAAQALVLAERDMVHQKMERMEEAYEKVKIEKRDIQERVQEMREQKREAEKRVDELEAGRMALLAERDGLAEGLRESFGRQSEAQLEIDHLRKELEIERAKSAMAAKSSPSPAIDLEAMAASSKSFQDSLLAEVSRLVRELGDGAQASKSEVEGLREDKRVLQNEVTELRKRTYEAASKIADADLRLATAGNAAASVESGLRRTLAATEQGKVTAERKILELEFGMERLRVEKVNMSTIATERSGAMRIMEIRHQALVQENIFWREFALSYDRRERLKYTQSQPFQKPSNSSSANAHTPTQAPANRDDTEVTVTPASGMEADLGGTPDLSMSASTPGEGMAHLTQTPGMVDDDEGTWWGAAPVEGGE